MIENNNKQESLNNNIIEEIDSIEDFYTLDKDENNFVYYCIAGVICALILVSINQFRVNAKIDNTITLLNKVKTEQSNMETNINNTNALKNQLIYPENNNLSTQEEEKERISSATKPEFIRLYSGFETKKYPEVESIKGYTMEIDKRSTFTNAIEDISIPINRTELKEVLSSLKKNDQKKIEYILSGLENKNIESLKEEDIKRLLSFMEASKKYNAKQYSPLKISSINYPDPSILDSDPTGYVINHLGQSQEMYGGITASLANVEKYLISKTR